MSDHDPTCLFCKIVAGSIPSTKILETDHVLAFLDIHPVNFGHVLLVPKAHHATLSDLPDDLAAETGRLIPRLCRTIKAATDADGLNLVVNNGEAAGQTVGHGHWHLIPRFVGDAVHWPWPHVSYQGDELATVQSKIEAGLKAGHTPGPAGHTT